MLLYYCSTHSSQNGNPISNLFKLKRICKVRVGEKYIHGNTERWLMPGVCTVVWPCPLFEKMDLPGPFRSFFGGPRQIFQMYHTEVSRWRWVEVNGDWDIKTTEGEREKGRGKEKSGRLVCLPACLADSWLCWMWLSQSAGGLCGSHHIWPFD